MALCRTDSDSDVHVYESTETGVGPVPSGVLVCCHAYDHFADHVDFRTKRYSTMIEHLRAHAAAGLQVPERVIPTLRVRPETARRVPRERGARSRCASLAPYLQMTP